MKEVSRLWLREARLRSNFVTPLPTKRGNFLGRTHRLPHTTAFIPLLLPPAVIGPADHVLQYVGPGCASHGLPAHHDRPMATAVVAQARSATALPLPSRTNQTLTWTTGRTAQQGLCPSGICSPRPRCLTDQSSQVQQAMRSDLNVNDVMYVSPLLVLSA